MSERGPEADDPPSGVDGPEGRSLWRRADRVLPGGGVYLTRSADFAGRGVLPGFIAAAEGCRVIDADGRGYLDFLGANGPNLLGYRHPEVEAAARGQAGRAVSASFLPPALVDLVEALLGRYPAMGWGIVSKTGSEPLGLSVRVARQHTQRSRVLAFESAYHGSDPELAIRPPAGALADVTRRVQRLAWNDADAVRALSASAGDSLAAVLLNPLDQNPRQPTRPAEGAFLSAIEALQQRNGVLLVLDDVRHGFRLHPRGSEHLLGVDPDLICLGKALGNGYSVSVLLGRESLRPAARKILYTSTYVFEAPPMRAALAVLDIYERDDVFRRLTRAGERLRDGLIAAAAATGHRISVTGPVTMPTLLFENDPGFERQRAFARRAAELGAIFHPALNWNLSLAHGDAEIEEALEIARRALGETPGPD